MIVILPNLPATFTPATPYTRDTQQPSYTSGDLVPLGPVQQDALQPTTLHLQGGLPRVNNGDGQHSSGWTQQATSCKDLGSINRLMDGVLRGHQQVLQPSHAIQLQKNFGWNIDYKYTTRKQQLQWTVQFILVIWSLDIHLPSNGPSLQSLVAGVLKILLNSGLWKKKQENMQHPGTSLSCVFSNKEVSTSVGTYCTSHLCNSFCCVLRRSKAPHHQFHPWEMRNWNMIGLKTASQPFFQQPPQKRKQIACEPASTSIAWG